MAKKFKTDISKDQFISRNKKMLEKNTDSKQARHDRMKNYGRWLLYGGVDHLPPDKVLAHHVFKKSPRKRQEYELESPVPNITKMFNDSIEEQNEFSMQTTSLLED
jgi:hypothetical protein